MKIVFFGTSAFAAKILEYLLCHHKNIVAVVTRIDKPRGRTQKILPSSVKEFILQKYPSIPLFQPIKASTEDFAQLLHTLKPDLFVVVAYGEIIKKNLLQLPKKGCINVHASLLPKYRGAAPMQRCLMNGDTETGVSIIEMVEEMDAGPILEREKIFITEEMTFGELEKKLCSISGPLLKNVLKKIEMREVNKIFQDHSEATFAPKISQEDRIIHWEDSAKNIHNRIRGLSPKPGAFCFLLIGKEKKRLIIKKSKVENEENVSQIFFSDAPGTTISYTKEGWIISCGKGSLQLLEVQLEGKNPLFIDDFIRGVPFPPKIIINE